MKISEKYFTEDWRALKFKDEKEWLKAIDIFYDRLSSRFLKYINKIEKYKYSGFAVMALDCLLIVILQQFSDGVPNNECHSQRRYVKYLIDNFDEFDSDITKMFYDQIRCGILHQSEVKSSSRRKEHRGQASQLHIFINFYTRFYHEAILFYILRSCEA